MEQVKRRMSRRGRKRRPQTGGKHRSREKEQGMRRGRIDGPGRLGGKGGDRFRQVLRALQVLRAMTASSRATVLVGFRLGDGLCFTATGVGGIFDGSRVQRAQAGRG
jgi:hypothetical protein